MPDLSAAIVVIGGQDVTRFTRVRHVHVDDVLNDQPNTASVTLDTQKKGAIQSGAFAAHAFYNTAFHVAAYDITTIVQAGSPIQLYLGIADAAHQFFGGHITSREQFYAQRPAITGFNLACADWTRRLNRRKVVKTYAAASASSIVTDLVANYAPGITSVGVQAGLPTIAGGIVFTFEELSRALSRVAEKIGAYWYIDYSGGLHFFTGNEPGTDPAPLVPGAKFYDLVFSTDVSQVRTRVVVEGMGSQTRRECLVGFLSMPMVDVTPFAVGGGLAIAEGKQTVAYSGKHTGGAATTVTSGPLQAPTAPSGLQAPTIGGLTPGAYRYGMTCLNGSRESEISGLSSPITVVGITAPGTTSAVAATGLGGLTPNPGSYYQWAMTYKTPQGESAPVLLSVILTIAAVPVPAALTGFTGLTATGGGLLTGVSYVYFVTYLTAQGETTVGGNSASQVLAGAHNALQITVPVGTDPRIRGRRLYRTSNFADPTNFPPRLVAELDNVQTTYVDKVAEANLGNHRQTVNTAGDGQSAQLTLLNVSTDARVTGRNLYRGGFGIPLASFLFVGAIQNNTQTTFLDDGHSVLNGANPPAVGVGETAAVSLTAALGPAGTTARRLYRTRVNGTDLKFLDTLPNNSTTGYTDTKPDTSLGSEPPSVSGWPIPVGANLLPVANLTGFQASATSWIVVGNQVILTLGASAASGPGNLFTASGVNAHLGILAPINPGEAVTACPTLVLSAGLTLALPTGAAVRLYAMAEDAAAQAALGAIEGGDGIVTHYIQDERLTADAAAARGAAELALFKNPEIRVQYKTFDPETRSGRIVHIALPAPTNLTGDFLIQRVTIDDIAVASNLYPRRTVQASSTRFTFHDVLNRLVMEQT